MAVAALLWIPRASTRAVVGYDDGVYLASVMAMRRGGTPFRDVYSSQGPVFLPLLRLGDILGFGTAWAARLVPMGAGLALVVIGYCLTRRVSDRWSAVAAAALVATSGALLSATVRIEADAVVAALSAGAVLAATSARRRWAVAAAVLIGLAIGVKSLMAAPALLAVMWLVGRRHVPRAVAVAVGAGTVVLLASVPWGLTEVWEQSVRLHVLARDGSYDLGDRLSFLRETVWQKDRLLITMGAVGVITWLARLRGRRQHDARCTRDTTVALWLWMGASVVLVVAHSPLWTQHLTVLVTPAAVLAARLRPPLLVIAVLALTLLPAHAEGAGWRLSQPGTTPSQHAIVELLGNIEPADGLVISDEPTLGWLADRASPGMLVDTSHVRIDAGQLTVAGVTAAAREPRVCAVVFWSGRFDDLPGLRASLVGYRTAFQDGRHLLLLRDRCWLRR